MKATREQMVEDAVTVIALIKIVLDFVGKLQDAPKKLPPMPSEIVAGSET